MGFIARNCLRDLTEVRANFCVGEHREYLLLELMVLGGYQQNLDFFMSSL